jgi:hypothetical protein
VEGTWNGLFARFGRASAVLKIDDAAFLVVEARGGDVLMGRPFGDFLVVMMFTCFVGLLRSEKEVRAHTRKSSVSQIASPKSLLHIYYINDTTKFRWTTRMLADRPTASLSSETKRQGCRDELTPLLEVFGLQRPGAASSSKTATTIKALTQTTLSSDDTLCAHSVDASPRAPLTERT